MKSKHQILTCSLVLSDSAGRFRTLDITKKDKAFQLIGVYEPNATGELLDFFRRIEPYMTSSKRVILMGDWNAVLDPNLDRRGVNRVTKTLDPRGFYEFAE